MKTWYITGASTGLGRQYTLAALKRGDRVAAASIDPENMRDYKESYGDQVLIQYLDVTKKDMVDKCFKEAVACFGGINICVNNAGYMLCGAVEEISEEEARRIFDCNFFGTLFVTQAAAEHMRKKRSGVIVQTASLAAIDTIAGEGLYGATKKAVLGMSQALHHELKDFGVKIVILEPGPIATNMAKRAKLCKREIADYAEVIRKERNRWQNQDAFENYNVGDPAFCAQALLKIVDSQEPPKEVALTSFANDILRTVTKERLDLADKWQEVTAMADFRSGTG